MRAALIVLGALVVTCVASLLVGWLFDEEDDYPETDYDAYDDLQARRKPGR